MVDSVNKMPRGFGFVTFRDPCSVNNVMEVTTHTLDGKKIDPKEAITKDHHASSQLSKSTSIDKKVFVGGLPHGCSVEEIKSYFGKYGAVAEVDVKIDRGTNKPRGFAFVEYKDMQGAMDATKKQFQMFKDKRVEVKQAENRIPGNTTPSFNPVQWQGYSSGQTAQQGPQYSYPCFYGFSQSSGSNYQTAPAAAYQTPQAYGHSHPTAPQQGYAPPQPSSYQQNGYQQYPAHTYQPQSFSSTGYGQPSYSASPGYSHQYSSSYPVQSESVPYAQTQPTSAYYSNSNTTYPTYPSDSRYTQPQQNQRNW